MPPAVRGDELADARTQQQSLQARIAAEQKESARLAADQANLATEMADTSDSLATVTSSLTTMQARVDSLAVQVGRVQIRYEALAGQLTDLERQLAVVEVEERAKQSELAQRKAVLAAHIRAAYRTSETSLLETILSAASFTDVLSDVSSYLDMAGQDRQLAEQIVSGQRALAALHGTVEQARDATDRLRTETAARKRQLDTQLDQLQDARGRLRRLERQIASQLAAQRAASAKLAANKAETEARAKSDQAALDAVNRRLQELAAAEASRGTIPSEFSGSMIWPMGGAISQDFGCTGFIAEPPYGSCAHFHQGIDIVAPYGTPIRAVADGVIVFVGYMPGDGAWDVEIAHSANLITLYGHMTAGAVPGVSYGARVRQGQIIGYEGNTGNSTGAHLHWGVYRNGMPINPRLFL
jgi:murein DD-endopeptidase MepM/ murein hydrolase activator NlpD